MIDEKVFRTVNDIGYRKFLYHEFKRQTGFYPNDKDRPRYDDAEYARICKLCKVNWQLFKMKYQGKTVKQPWEPDKPPRSWQSMKKQWARYWRKKKAKA